MRNFTLISILLALLGAGFLWQKLLVKPVPDRLPETSDYSLDQYDQTEEEYQSDECNEYNQEASECEPETVSSEQNEMGQQRSQGHDVMMKSFDKKYDKYKDQINGQQ